MSNIPDMLKQHTVMVEEASGVLINPSSGDHSYIITAKHNLNDKIKANEIIVKDHTQQIIILDNVYIHDDLDLAILITKEKFDLSLNIHNAPFERDLSICFFGYPMCRRDLPITTNELPGIIQSIDTQLLLSLEHPIGHKEIVGMSGGGIFHIENQQIFLCGIETNYGGDPNIEFTTNILAIPLNVIQDFIKEKALPELCPKILNNFTDIIQKTFSYFSDYSDDADNLSFLLQILHTSYREKASSATTPPEIHHHFKEKLLAKNCSAHHFYSDTLWVSFLEFLIINSLIDEQDSINIEYINKLSQKRKFLFIDCKHNWIRNLNVICSSDFQELRTNGIIIISSYESKPDLTFKSETREKLITNIGRAITSSSRHDQAIKNPIKEFNIYHLSGLHSCIVEKEYDFSKFFIGSEDGEVQEALQSFIKAYREYITN